TLKDNPRIVSKGGGCESERKQRAKDWIHGEATGHRSGFLRRRQESSVKIPRYCGNSEDANIHASFRASSLSPTRGSDRMAAPRALLPPGCPRLPPLHRGSQGCDPPWPNLSGDLPRSAEFGGSSPEG